LIDSFTHIIDRFDKLLVLLEKSIVTITTDNVYTFGFNLETHTIAEPIAVEGSHNKYRDRLEYISTQMGVEPVINLVVKFIKKDITKEEALKIMTDVIHKCRDQFKLSATSINNIKSAK
jgi:hypothetical protein